MLNFIYIVKLYVYLLLCLMRYLTPDNRRDTPADLSAAGYNG